MQILQRQDYLIRVGLMDSNSFIFFSRKKGAPGRKSDLNRAAGRTPGTLPKSPPTLFLSCLPGQHTDNVPRESGSEIVETWAVPCWNPSASFHQL